ncbi:mannose-1-phosphate guanylyltransferase / phosphomannomutase [Malonomonas rubra DSM 5091]|uniref:Mannose-1-phosphate guanylyltransferase / phosphomannomutase n=1 Tax=Malonomonas rubra DSM 5091 TaxID=1122189 RepID=A0A1M6J9E1_MALRU|nr:mannose-1-phosphate guanyltransferase [Malonomonas rubra]SHJ43303.1 mannose-1-phosphate guanylyltransferase / phosphomannomutase [Malonomonas rubra DSM 5091]
MKAVIMAGGFGTRLHPLSINLPKPMVPLCNRPIMLHIVDLLKKHGITELVMLLYFQPDTVKKFFGDGSEYGVNITYVTPLEDLGTAGAVKAAARHLDERFLIISGDLLTDFDLTAAIKFHEAKNAKATLTLTSVPDPLQFGVVITNQKGEITKFLEKPDWGEVFSDTINTGIYILEPEVLDLIPEGENRDWSKDIFPQLLQQKDRLYGCTLKGYWQDIGNTDAYLETCKDIMAGKVEIEIDETLTEKKKVFFGAETSVSEDTQKALRGMVVLGDNTRLVGKPKLKNCLIGRNCTIEDGAELEDCILWDNVYVKANSKIKGTVLGQNVRVGVSAIINQGVVVGDNSKVGKESTINADVKIWPSKNIENSAIVTHNLIWGEIWRKSLFEGALVKGLTNIELTPEFAAKLGAAYGSTLPKDSFVLTGRDSIRSSRMLKRAFVGGLLSAGVNVRDVKRLSLPVLRYKLTTFGEVGGVHFRQSPRDAAVTEIIFFDEHGLELSSAAAKSIERIYYKENFRRVHYSEPGSISELPNLYSYYRDGFLRTLDRDAISKAKPRVVVDLNHSPAAEVLPALLTELGCDVIELNSHIDESYMASALEDQIESFERVGQIVTALGATAGFWLGPSGEKAVYIDGRGKIFSQTDTLALAAALITKSMKDGSIAVPIAAPHTIEEITREQRVQVIRTKGDGRSLGTAAQDKEVHLCGDIEGRLAYTGFQPHFDALYAVAKTIELLTKTGETLDGLHQRIPKRPYRQIQLPCSWEYKGGIMRLMNEATIELQTTFVDGVKVHFGDDWVLVIPDPYRPLVHILAEANTKKKADSLIKEYREKVEEWLQLLQNPA